MQPTLVAQRTFPSRTQVVRDARFGWQLIQADRHVVLLDEELDEIASVPLPDDALGVHGVTPDRHSVAVSASSRIALVSADGHLEWEVQHPPWGQGGSVRGSCFVTDDGAYIWATVPGSGPDEWWLIAAASGEVAGTVALDCHAAGSEPIRHPNGRHVGLSVGEGQDGSQIYWGRIQSGQPVVAQVPGDSRVLVDVSLDGRHFLTAPHDAGPVLLHRFPDGVEEARLPITEVLEFDDAFDYFAGFLDTSTVLVALRERDDLLLASAEDLSQVGWVQMPGGRAGNPVLTGGSGTFLCMDHLAGSMVLTLWELSGRPTV